MNQYLIIHYSEIALKKGNKRFFVSVLVKNVEKVLRGLGMKGQVTTVLSRLMVKLPERYGHDEIVNSLRKIPGIKNFGFYLKSSTDLEVLSEDLVAGIPFKEIKAGGYKTFCVRVKKSQGYLPYTSVELEAELGGVLLDGEIGLKAKMKDPDLNVNVEIFNGNAYFSYEKYEGIAGLPSGSGGKVVSLISSGFDSPVASYMMMRRGAKVSFVHFSGYPYAGKDQEEHVKDIVKILGKYQENTVLHIVPFGEIQKKISLCGAVDPKYRVVVYRRLMFRIAQEIAFKESAKALVTGENFGQVASQTLINMATIDEVARMPVFRPLIAFDKEDTIKLSKEIGTHDISCLPCDDTCSLFMPKNPELAAKVADIEICEKALGIDGLMGDALEGAKVFKFK